MMPDGIKRIVSLPKWAWVALDELKESAFKAAVSLSWSKTKQYERNDAFEYLLIAFAHSDRRRIAKLHFYLDVCDTGIIAEPKFPVNDHYNPQHLPDFPDPWWAEAECWETYKKRIKRLFNHKPHSQSGD